MKKPLSDVADDSTRPDAGAGEGTPAATKAPQYPPTSEEDGNDHAVVDETRKRQDRNLREQARSQRITQQIKELRDLLSDSQVQFKPTKFSILACVVEYIKQLQSHATLLDAEHEKLIRTIQQTNEAMTSGTDGRRASPTNTSIEVTSTSAFSGSPTSAKTRSNLGDTNDAFFINELNYRNLFDQCSAALAVTALDGRFLDCNSEFRFLSGYSKEELLTLSLFDLLSEAEMGEAFQVMGQMLRENFSGGGDEEKEAGVEGTVSLSRTFWSGVAFSAREQQSGCRATEQLLMNVTLVQSSDGTPKFFNCALIVPPPMDG